MIAYSQVGHTNFCYKYCALMIDIAHGKVGRVGRGLGGGGAGGDQAKQMDFQLWSQKAGGAGGREGGRWKEG